MASYLSPNTDNVGANPYGLTPMTPEEMKSAYAEIDQRHTLRNARQDAKLAPQSGATTGAYPGKQPVKDPTTTN